MNMIERKKINPNLSMKGFPLLAMEQFERLIMAHNVEFRGGFYMQASTMTGETREIYVPDTREVFCNTCKALAILIQPSFTKETKEKCKDILEKLEDLMKKFLEATSVKESIVLGESFYQEAKDKILLEEYNNTKVALYQELFEVLTYEFKNHRYWVKSTSDD